MIAKRFTATLARHASPGAVRRLFTGNTGVVAVTALLQNALRIIGSMVLTRLLDANAYGVVGIVTSVTVVFAMVSDIGIMAFVIRSERSDDPVFLDEVWTVRLIRSAALSLAIVAVSGPIAAFLGKPELHWPIAVGSLNFLIEGASSMAFVTTLRQFKVRQLAVIDVATQVSGIVLTVILALVFHNYWAILLGGSFTEAVRTAISYLAFPGSGRRWRPSRRLAGELWSFSKFITGSTIITLLLSQTDKLVLSKAFTISMLGLYVLASNLATAPTGLASAYAQRILYPSYARIAREEPDTLAEQFYAIRIRASMLYSFAVGGLIATGPLVVRLLYDDRYQRAGMFVQLLAISSLFYLGNVATNEVMIARGKARFTFTVNLVRLGFLAVAGTGAYARFGPIGLVVVIGSIEAVAQLYGWFRLWRDGLLDGRREATILAAGGGGVLCGSLVVALAALA